MLHAKTKARKIAVVALSVFGPGLGTLRQSQMVLAVLLVCISLEIAGDPYKVSTRGARILGRLEIGALFVQWATMWGGTMIYASQDIESKRFVEFLSVVIVGINVALFCWSVLHLLVACKIEKDMKKRRRIEEDLANRKITEQKETCWDYIGDKLKWFSYLMISEDERQARTRRRTFDSTDQQNNRDRILSRLLSYLR